MYEDKDDFIPLQVPGDEPIEPTAETELPAENTASSQPLPTMR